MENLGSILAFIGVGVMLFGSGTGSAVGTAMAGSAAIGAMKRKDDAFGLYLVLTALPGTQGLYGFGGFFLLMAKLQESLTVFQGSAILGAGIALGFVGLTSAISQAKVCANTISSIASGQDTFGKGLILAVFPELYAIVAFASTFLLISLM
jgi:V/A-type H+-transporting ATPase subunit K